MGVGDLLELAGEGARFSGLGCRVEVQPKRLGCRA